MKRVRIVPGTTWTVEPTTLMVVDTMGVVSRLDYPDAAIWDLLTRGYPPRQVSRMIAAIARLDTGVAEAAVRSAVEAWARVGLVEAVDEDG